MLYDRPYMQPGQDRKGPSALGWLLILNIGIYILDRLLFVFLGQPTPDPSVTHGIQHFALNPEGFKGGKIWTILTYSFLHGDILHIAFNMLITYGIGKSLQRELGEKQFLYLYFGGVLVGGIVGLLVNFGTPVNILGASGGVLALISVYCFQRWDMPVSLLFIEITFKLKWLFFFILGINVFGFVFQEMGQQGGSTANSVHLGGILLGFLFYKYLMVNSFNPGGIPQADSRPELPKWFQSAKKAATGGGKAKRQPKSQDGFDRKGLQAEVDRILDKINAQGFGSLSEEEKKTLDRAKDMLSK